MTNERPADWAVRSFTRAACSLAKLLGHSEVKTMISRPSFAKRKLEKRIIDLFARWLVFSHARSLARYSLALSAVHSLIRSFSLSFIRSSVCSLVRFIARVESAILWMS